jgi:hypothetical protein
LRRRRPSLWDARHRTSRATHCRIRAGRPYCCQSFRQSCSGWGLPGRHLPMPPVRSYRTISPLLQARACSGLFLWHFPSGRPDQPLAGTLALRSPDFPQAAIISLPAVARRARQAHYTTARNDVALRSNHLAIKREQRAERRTAPVPPYCAAKVYSHRACNGRSGRA